jgi:adenylate cyclase
MLAPALNPNSPLGTTLLAAGGVFILVLLLRMAGVLQPGELALYDLQLQRVAAQPRDDLPIALVLIDEQDIRRLGHPLSDKLLRRLIERLLAAEARAVGIDLYRDQPVPAADGDPTRDTQEYLELGQTVTSDDRVIMTMKFPSPDRFGTPPPRFLRDDLQLGFSDLPVDPGGTIRRGLLFLWDGDRPLLSFSLQVVLRYLRPESIGLLPARENPDEIRLGETVVSPLRQGFGPYTRVDDGGYQLLLDYRWGEREIPSYRASSVLDGEVSPDSFRDRVVLVGTAAPSVKDFFFTPHSRGGGGQPMYGVEVQAQLVDQLIRFATGVSRPLAASSRLETAAWMLLWAVLGASIAAFGRSLVAVIAAGLLSLSLLVVCTLLAFASGLWLPLLAPLLAGVGAAGVASGVGSISERAQRRQLAALFSRFQGTAIAEEIWNRRQEFLTPEGRPVSRRSIVTTLMTDLEGYTAASEKVDPGTLMAWVNEFLSVSAALVEDHGGVVDDYTGDGLKANFGFPAPSRSEGEIDAAAAAAVRSGIALGQHMQVLNQAWIERGLPTARVRIGIFTGVAVMGFIGGDRALKYTTIGASVNTASRLEQFGKDEFAGEEGLAWRVLIGEETHLRTQGLFEVAALGAQRLKGIDGPVSIYRVMGEA